MSILSDKKKVTIVIPFLGKISLQVKKRLRDIFKTYKPDIKLNTVFKAPNRLANGFHFKDVISKGLKSFVLYKFKCSTCNSTYLGETTRHCIVRSYEHMTKSILTNKDYTYNEATATIVGKRVHSNNHPVCDDDITIIGSASNEYCLKIKESLIIKIQKAGLNIAGQSVPLHLFN